MLFISPREGARIIWRHTRELRLWPHIVLLGDSIFDNASYTSGGPDVMCQVREILPKDWRATLLAVDGAVTLNVPDQVQRMTRRT